jgi:hypothetical protein
MNFKIRKALNWAGGYNVHESGGRICEPIMAYISEKNNENYENIFTCSGFRDE